MFQEILLTLTIFLNKINLRNFGKQFTSKICVTKFT